MTDTIDVRAYVPTVSERGFLCVLLAVAVLASVVPYTNDLGFLPSYLPVVGAIGLLTTYTLLRGTRQLVAPKYALALLGYIWLVYIYHLFLGDITGAEVARVPVFIVTSVVTLVYLPYQISLDDFATVVAIAVASIVVVGLFGLIVGEYRILVFDVTQWRWPFKPVPFLPFEIRPIKSIFANPNPFSQFALVGTFAAAIAYLRYRTPIVGALIVINAVGLFLSNSRGAMVALLVGTGFVVLSRVTDRRFVVLGVVGVGVALSGGVLTWLELIPSIGPLGTVDLSGRSQLWQGALRAALTQPITGLGPGETGAVIEPFVLSEKYAGAQPHSSYIRMIVTTGIPGLIAYVLVLFVTAERLARRVTDLRAALLFGLVIAVIVHQTFEYYSLFGISSTSLLASFVFGYALAYIVRGDDRRDRETTPNRPNTDHVAMNGD